MGVRREICTLYRYFLDIFPISPQVTVYIRAPEDRIGEHACNKAFAGFLSNKCVPLLQEPRRQ